MHRLSISATAVLVASALWACSSAPAPAESPELTAPTVPTGNEATASTSLGFHEAVEPIFQARCQKCHHRGGIAPFTLTEYAVAKAQGPSVLAAVEARIMPPWGAYDDEGCKMERPLLHDERLTEAEIATIRRWVEEGMAEGSKDAAPAPLSFGSGGLEGMTHEFGLAVPYTVKAEHHDEMRCFPIETNLEADTWFDASGVVPGNPKVVHHVLVFQDRKAEGAAQADASGSYECFGGPNISSPALLLAWAPGNRTQTYGPEAGLLVTKGAHLVIQVHYHPSHDTAEPDQTRFQLRALAAPPKYSANVALIGNSSGKDPESPLKLLAGPNDPDSGPEFWIPANVKGHTEAMSLTVPVKSGPPEGTAWRIGAIGTHMHWAGVDMKIRIDRKVPSAGNPAQECLLGTPRYDFNWQRAYPYAGTYEELPTVAVGDTLHFTCTYDNTMQNRYIRKALSEKNLSSPVHIRLGETTLDEMCLGGLVLLQPVPPPTPPASSP